MNSTTVDVEMYVSFVRALVEVVSRPFKRFIGLLLVVVEVVLVIIVAGVVLALEVVVVLVMVTVLVTGAWAL